MKSDWSYNGVMRTETKAEAELMIAAVLKPAAERVLHEKRMRALQRARLRASVEARANGFTEQMLTDLLAR